MKMLLAGIIALGFLLRVIWLDQFPVGFTGDEAQQGYSAYSILKTGRDEWGQFLTLFPRGFGDYKPPLYTYLSIPSVAIFGLNEFAVRFLTALLGTLTILIAYFLGKELFSRNVGIWSALLLAISPWGIQLSRTAFEGGIGIPIFGLGLLFYLRSKRPDRRRPKRNQLFLILSFLIFGFNLYSYHSWRLFTIIFLPVIIINEYLENKKWKTLLLPVLIFSLFLLPLVSNSATVLKRSSDVSIFSEKNIKNYFVNKGTSDLPENIARIFDNKIIFITDQFLTNYLSYFSPTFFFTGSRPDNSYLNFPGTPLMYFVEIIFVGVGILGLMKNKEKNAKLIYTCLIFAPIPAALTDGFNAQRATTFLPLMTIISAYGLNSIISNTGIKLFKKYQSLIQLIPIFVLLGSTTLFLYNYVYKLPKHPANNLRYGYREAFLKAISLEDQFDSIVFSKEFSMPQIFIAFYKRTDPWYFQSSSQDWLRYEQAKKTYVDQLESYNLGKYEIKDINWEKELKSGKHELLVSSYSNFPEKVKPVLDIKSPKGVIIYRLVSTSENQPVEVQK